MDGHVVGLSGSVTEICITD